MKINKKLIKELVNCLEENKLSELEYSEKDIKIKVARNSFKDNSKIEILQNTKEIKRRKNYELELKLNLQLLELHILHLSQVVKNLLKLEKKSKKEILL